jgi:2,3-bisphosphoglycerate-dependent phosphoglycerate mutase
MHTEPLHAQTVDAARPPRAPKVGLRRVDLTDLAAASDGGRAGSLVLLRHAQSQWNLENRFTGWADVGLTDLGREEARRAARELAAAGLRFDEAHVSRLSRARETLDIVLTDLGSAELPVYESWRLNERHYGSLQGLDKSETAARHGEAQVLRWRRGYADRPPALDPTDPRHPANDPAFAALPRSARVGTENLADTLARLLPYWEERLLPALRAGRDLLVASHGNTLRALIKHLEGLSVAEVEGLEIPTATPVVYLLERPVRV